jgi:formylglycine-generating enzyme required for sulfatase activity
LSEPRIFLCHASEDKPRVRELYHRLKEAGYHPWLDKEDLLPGQDWRHEIEKIIRDPYNIVVVCLSCNSVTKRGVVQQEIKWALDVLDQTPEGTIYLIPARLEECQAPDRLSQLHWVELFEPDGFGKLKQALNFELGKRQLPRQAEPLPKAQVAQPVVLERRQPFEPEMVLIPAGEFLMGSDPNRDIDAQGDELPQHRLYLPDYHIAKTPVTSAQYWAFAQSASHKQPGTWKGKQPPQGRKDHPVVNVSWHDTVAYCKWLAQVTGKHFRLPSEAEWEKAARGTDGRIYPWGNEPPDESRCNFDFKIKETTLVGSYPQGASPYGLLDMAGNVYEWCHSLYRPYLYNATDGREGAGGWDDERVLRGGAFNSDARYVRCASRYRYSPDYRNYYAGFRLVLAPRAASS